MATEIRAGRPGKRPAHPGAILREDILPALKAQGTSKAALARALGIERQSLYDILGEKRAITPDVAARLGRCFGNTAMFWLTLQAAHDLWHVEQQPDVRKVQRIAA